MTQVMRNDEAEEIIDKNDQTGQQTALEQLLTEHRKQKKDLQSKATSMKHSVAKTNTKKKREILAEIEKMEKEMRERHQKEVTELENAMGKMNVQSNEHIEETESIPAEQESQKKSDAQRISKAQKRREKKADSSRRRLEAEKEDSENAKFARGRIEMEAIENVLKERGLSLHEISADGDCLYNAIAHQLSLLSKSSNDKISMSDIRSKAATYIRSHKDDFLPFLSSRDGEPISEFYFDEYCNLVERSCENGGEWGGEPELRALSSALERSIIVIQPEGRLIKFGDEFSSKTPITITFHRYAFNLGEHYNSTKPINRL